MAIAFEIVILSAIFVGVMWGGKTWCNFFCPANIVQRIYTEPRGIFESSPHIIKNTTPQSMCRSPSVDGDKTACVACTRSCGDIDLEKSYWDTVDRPERRNVYYAFVGLIFGFYGYYFLYSGSWKYYFSGIWTHEDGQLATILQPGFYFLGGQIWCPKIVAAPLTLAICSVVALLVGKGLEKLYRRAISRKSTLSEAEIVHHCLATAAYVAINSFYLFGGRPNILLLPVAGQHLVDIFIVAITTIWFWQTVRRTPAGYRRESLAGGLVENLRKNGFDASSHFDGRTLEQLKPDEIYVLSKVLPVASKQQTLEAYRNVLDHAISNQQTGSADMQSLREFQKEIGVTDAEHLATVDALDPRGTIDISPDNTSPEERALCSEHYYNLVAPLLAAEIEMGRTIEEIESSPEFSGPIEVFRNSLQISEQEHLDVIGRLEGEDGFLVQRMQAYLSDFEETSAFHNFTALLDVQLPYAQALKSLATRALNEHLLTLGKRLLAIAAEIGPVGGAVACRARLFEIDPELAGDLVSQKVHDYRFAWLNISDPAIHEARASGPALAEGDAGPIQPSLFPRFYVQLAEVEVRRRLIDLLVRGESILAALLMVVSSYVDLSMARDLAAEIPVNDDMAKNWLILEVVSNLLYNRPQHNSGVDEPALLVEVSGDGPISYITASADGDVSVGRAPSNDLAVNHPRLAPYHLSIHRNGDTARVLRLNDADLYVDGQLCRDESVEVANGGCISLTGGDSDSVRLRLTWALNPEGESVQTWDTVTKMVWLSCSERFRPLPIADLARLASQAAVRRYRKDAIINLAGAVPRRVLLLQCGTVEIEEEGQIERFSALSSFDELAVNPPILNGRRSATIRVASEFAIGVLVAPFSGITQPDQDGGHREDGGAVAA